MRRRSRTPASPCATLSSPCVCRSLRCTCRTSSGENRSAAARCWRTSRSAWWRGSARRAIGWDSRAWSAISGPAMIADPRRARQEALAAALVAEGLDGLLVASPANIRYLTGFSGSAAIVAVAPGGVPVLARLPHDAEGPGAGGGSVAPNVAPGARGDDGAGNRGDSRGRAAATWQRGAPVPDDRRLRRAHRAAPRALEPADPGGG